MAGRHISSEEHIRRAVIKCNFQDEEIRNLAESEGSVEAIRERAVKLAHVRQAIDVDPLSVGEFEGYTREEREALFIINTIDQLAKAERKLAEEAVRRPIRSPEEMNGITPLTRATLEGGRDKL
ncbi:MAG: hypothetical protein JWO55_261 [Candidatus Saccharibacteria bacterium]|jgi:hypothetical protein|nr:hypothetical protein [Candidatus Saccharibacteria bacterium]